MTLNPFTWKCDVTWKWPLKVRNSKPLSPFVFFFTLACERIWTETHSTESRCEIEPENGLFAGMSLHFQSRNFTGWGSEGQSYGEKWDLELRRLSVLGWAMLLDGQGRESRWTVVLPARRTAGHRAGSCAGWQEEGAWWCSRAEFSAPPAEGAASHPPCIEPENTGQPQNL